jgi:cytochrome oxidase Cu insertion factor (SCO1/SenC/PrrC family)
MPELIRQQTVSADGDKVEKLTVSVDAVNELVARQRARAYVRREFPLVKNILNPELDETNTIQSTFNDIVPEIFEREEHEIEIMVVR